MIRGSGDVFSAGYDIGNLSEQEFEESAEKLVAHPFHDAIEALEAYRYPVIAQINGHAIGGGLELALTCDIRIAASGVKMGMPPAKLGLIYSHTGLAKFIDVCGPANTAELFFVGRNIDSERAHEMGLVNEVSTPTGCRSACSTWPARSPSNAPLSLAGNKRMLRELRALRLPAELERELVELRESCFASEDFREGVQAFAEKRKPQLARPLARSAAGETELHAGEIELAALSQLALFCRPRGGLVRADRLMSGDVLLDDWYRRAAVGVRC